jgi:hypothetical protein
LCCTAACAGIPARVFSPLASGAKPSGPARRRHLVSACSETRPKNVWCSLPGTRVPVPHPACPRQLPWARPNSVVGGLFCAHACAVRCAGWKPLPGSCASPRLSGAWGATGHRCELPRGACTSALTPRTSYSALVSLARLCLLFSQALLCPVEQATQKRHKTLLISLKVAERPFWAF